MQINVVLVTLMALTGIAWALPTGLPTQSSDVLAKRGLRKGQKCAKRGVFGICEWWQDVHGPSEAAAPETVERVEMGPFEPSEGTAPDN